MYASIRCEDYLMQTQKKAGLTKKAESYFSGIPLQILPRHLKCIINLNPF